MSFLSTRVITVYDQYGYPIPKVIDYYEARASSRAQSRSPSPYKLDYHRQALDDSTQHHDKLS